MTGKVYRFKDLFDVKLAGAVCASGEYDPELWTGNREDMTLESYRAHRKLAQMICRQCPVMDKCGEYALKHPELSGVWGGMLDEQRNEMRKRISLVH